MKQIKIISIIMMLSLAASAQTISVDDITINTYQTDVVSIRLSGGASTIATGFYVVLPDGVTLTDIITSPNESLESNHVVRSYPVSSGKVRMAVYSPDNECFQSSTGSQTAPTLMKLKLKAGNKAGAYLGKITGIEFSSAPGHLAHSQDVTFTITVKNSMLGDVNSDGKVTPSDAIMILYHFFNVMQSGFNQAVADVNGDRNISPADAIEVLYIYFGGGKSGNARGVRPTVVNVKEPE